MTTAACAGIAPIAVTIEPGGLAGLLRCPPSASGLVIFAHGSGSGRLSPRNNHVAEGLGARGLATLLLDLLTPDEEPDRSKVFDIPLLARRLMRATAWSRRRPDLAGLPLGYFGASTGAGAALLAASESEAGIGAIVSRGGRPDLAGSSALARVAAPTLFIVGSHDLPVIDLNRMAMRHMRTETSLVIVHGAGHLFEEPGTLDEVMDHAAAWFLRHFGARA